MVDLDADHLAARLDEIAAEIGTAPRAVEYARVLRAGTTEVHAGRPLAGDARIQEFALALQDSSLVVGAFDGLMRAPELPTTRDRFRRALDGSTVVVPEHGDDASRNVLWELFVAACLRNGEFQPEFGDLVSAAGDRQPDLFATVRNLRLAVEAKRVRGGRRQLPAHVKKAVGQIEAACTCGLADAGFIAIDLSFAFGEHAQRKKPWGVANRAATNDVKKKLKPRLDEQVRAIGPMVARQRGAKYIVGATIMVLPVLHYADTRQLGLVRFCGHGFLDGNRPVGGVAAFKEIYQRCFSSR